MPVYVIGFIGIDLMSFIRLVYDHRRFNNFCNVACLSVIGVYTNMSCGWQHAVDK